MVKVSVKPSPSPKYSTVPESVSKLSILVKVSEPCNWKVPLFITEEEIISC